MGVEYWCEQVCRMWHEGLSSTITFDNKNIWSTFTGLRGLRKMIKMKE